MKRSETIAAVATAEAAFSEAGWELPPFAKWSPSDWPAERSEISEVLAGSPGWDVAVVIDAGLRTVAAGGTVTPEPGESISLSTGLYHSFWAIGAPVDAGEVSSVNDDVTDDVFYEELGRFPDIVEDEEPVRLLVGDYGHLGEERADAEDT